jgi:hypothetical protein
MNDDHDLIERDQESRRRFIEALREQNEKRKGELAAERVFDGPEPLDWRQRRSQREPVPVATLRHLTEAEIIRLVDRRMSQWIEQERHETERRIADVVENLESQAADALEEVERALNNVAQRAHTDLTNSDAARRAAVEAMYARYEVLEARIKLLLASENATVIEPTRTTPRRTN